MIKENCEKFKLRNIRAHQVREASFYQRYESRMKYLKEERIPREERNKNILLKYIEALKAEFPEYAEHLNQSVFKVWERRRYTRDAFLAHYDVERAFKALGVYSKVQSRLSKCNEIKSGLLAQLKP